MVCVIPVIITDIVAVQMLVCGGSQIVFCTSILMDIMVACVCVT